MRTPFAAARPSRLPPLLLGALVIAAMLPGAPAGVPSATAAGCPPPGACRAAPVRPHPEPEARLERADDRAERVSRRSIGDLGRGKAPDPAPGAPGPPGADAPAPVPTTSDAPAALPLTLLPSAASALRWPPEDEVPSPPAPPAALAIPLLPPTGGGLPPAAPTAPTAAPSQLADRTGSRLEAAADAGAAESDVWFPDSVRRPPAASAGPQYNRAPDDVTKRPSWAGGDSSRRPADYYRATDEGGWRPAEDAVEPYRGSADDVSRWPPAGHYRPNGFWMTTRRTPALHSEYPASRRPFGDVGGAGGYRPAEAWGTTRRPSDNSYYSSDFLSPSKWTGTRQQPAAPDKHWPPDGGARATTPSPGGRRPAAAPGGRAGTISKRKCAEYARLQTEKVVALPLVPEPRPSVQRVQKCDANSVPLVVGGQDARLHEFPHMAAIGYRGQGPRVEWNCGGSLISELFVLTAAHCTATAQGPPIRVRLGEHNIDSAEDGARPVDVAVSSMVRHPEYQPPSRYHDIGLLRLARRVAFGAAVRPACLHAPPEPGAAPAREDEDLAVEPLIAVGWGLTEQLGERSQVLQKVILNFVEVSTCRGLYAADASTSSLSRGILSETQLCAGVLDGGRDTCQGDSGGPLQISSHDNRCVFHIVGITSFGKVCGARNAPGVYTRVSRYIPWIERHVWPEERRD